MSSLLITVGGLTLAALVSPGPNFVLITGRAMASGRRAALAAAWGIAMGTATHAVLGIVGFGALLRSSYWVFTGAKLLGASYLFWIGFKSIRGAWRSRSSNSPETEPDPKLVAMSAHRSLADGWLTQMSNPKTTLFFLALFTTVVPSDASFAQGSAVVLTVVLLAAAWYSVVAMAFSVQAVRRVYRSVGRYIDAVFGGVMIALGIRIASTTR